jgi:hypothetical protein
VIVLIVVCKLLSVSPARMRCTAGATSCIPVRSSDAAAGLRTEADAGRTEDAEVVRQENHDWNTLI